MRLVLLCHGSTAATRNASFPGDEPLEAGVAPRVAALTPCWPRGARAFSSPARRARETAEQLGLLPDEAPALRDVEVGRWAGRSLAEISRCEPEALGAWMADPNVAAGGGESHAELVSRVAAWLENRRLVREPAIAVTHASVIRAAIVGVLGADAAAGRAIDVAPLTAAILTTDGRRWRLAGLVPPK